MRQFVKVLFVAVFLSLCGIALNLARAAETPPATCTLLEVEGKVEVARKGSATWSAGQLNATLQPGDRLRTGLRSRATLRWSELSVVRVNELTSMEIQPPAKPTEKAQLDLRSGATYFFSREKPTEVQFRTPVASGAIRGTEFNLKVAEDGRTELALLDGAVDLSNPQGATTLASGEQGTVEAGKAPVKAPLLEAINVIQWVLYYPAVVDPDELGLGQSEKDATKDSLSAYRQGDLHAALDRYPQNRSPATDAERSLLAALLLAVGRVDQTEAELKNLPPDSAAARALRELISAVKHQPLADMGQPRTGSEWLARSYYLQSRAQLADALNAAREATSRSPEFGAAWVRVAELEFSFGRTDDALSALNKGLEISPKNAQGLALKGYLLAAKNQFPQAWTYFDRAIEADGALANAWLGRGLVKIRQGLDRNLLDIAKAKDTAGRDDLQVAATLEPQRAILRSYLGKAFGEEHDLAHARKELDLAQKLDPNDPTSWLYLALLNQQNNRINDAVSDLEKSKELNGNRSLFRSRMLLDQDQAVRGANLAAMYRDEKMLDYGVQEASRAVDSDYANSSAHLFLANNYDSLRDTKLINLRYETPWFSELLVANLLAPVGVGNLSQNVSQQEYSRLFASDGLGIYSSTEYTSRGDWIQNGSVYGTFGNFGFSLDGGYQSQLGYRVNNDLTTRDLAARFKEQVTEKDSVFFQVSEFHSDSGDVAQYYDQHGTIPGVPHPDPNFRATEEQWPNTLLGYHRQWAPGSDTLLLWGRIDDSLTLRDPADPGLLWLRSVFLPSGALDTRIQSPAFFALDYNREIVANSVEIQHIWQCNPLAFEVGGRYQTADPDTTDNLDRIPPLGSPTPVHQQFQTDLDRYSIYAYAHWQIIEPLQVIGGVSYDRLHFPVNIDTSPITSDEDTKDAVSPKAGLLWSPFDNTHVRGVFTRSLGGVFFDQSVRLEPTEVAGFNQAFRSLAPESAVGLVPGTKFETWGVGADQSFKTGTYLLAQYEDLKSDAIRTVGILTNSDQFFAPIPDSASSTRQSVNYEEKSLVLAASQLVGEQWTFGTRYKMTDAHLDAKSVDIAASTPGASVLNPNVSATLHQVDLFTIFQHRCGFFSQFDALWTQQSNRHYTPDIPGDDFWQFNFYAGYRFLQRRVEAQLGVLNLTDRDYKLNPLTLYNELPRQRTLTVSLKLNF
jgi:tetratricopeptide (TPR) repeat protein